MALESEADELFYGGAAGGAKSETLLALGLFYSERAILFRREYKQLRGLIDRSREIMGGVGTLNESSLVWRLPGGRVLEFGAVEHEWDVQKFQGRPHSKKLFDELPQFSQSQYRFLIGWARTTNPNERVRIVGAGNPPTDVDGEWVIQHWAPWLDPQYSHQAEPGELRWFAVVDGEDVERENGQPFTWKGETITPRSRTFIPARISDNPHLVATGYVATLQGMPEPLRSQMLYGDFSVGRADNAYQVIPTDWVRRAQARWHADGREGTLTQAGIDIAQGGKDSTAIACRYGTWFDQIEMIPGQDVPDAQVNADHVARVLVAGGTAAIDADGIGSSTYFLAQAQVGQRVLCYQGSAPTDWQDRARVLSFRNVRAAAYWALREALDPANKLDLALPPDRDLRVELCAPIWEQLPGGVIKLEAKEDITTRLGRSPDKADAVVMSWWTDPLAAYRARLGQTRPVPQPRSQMIRNGRVSTRGGR